MNPNKTKQRYTYNDSAVSDLLDCQNHEDRALFGSFVLPQGPQTGMLGAQHIINKYLGNKSKHFFGTEKIYKNLKQIKCPTSELYKNRYYSIN